MTIKLGDIWDDFAKNASVDGADLSACAAAAMPDIIESIVEGPEMWRIEKLRGFAVTRGSTPNSSPQEAPWLLIVRVVSDQGQLRVAFIEGTTIALCWIELLYQETSSGSVRWKEDEQRKPKGKSSFLDAIAGDKS